MKENAAESNIFLRKSDGIPKNIVPLPPHF
jgi:hypothetical protein